jgi:hypothetical protein
MRFVLFDGKKALKNLYMPKGQKTQWSKEKETNNYIEIHRLVFCVVFCLSFCMFSFGHCVVWPFLLAIVLSGLFFWHLCCLAFCDLWILITPLIYSFITCITIVCMSTFQLPINLSNHSVR